MKFKIIAIFISLSVAVPSPSLWAQNLALQPLQYRYKQLASLKNQQRGNKVDQPSGTLTDRETDVLADKDKTPENDKTKKQEKIKMRIPALALHDFVVRFAQLEVKDHNEMLFYLLNEYQSKPKNRDLISLILTAVELNLNQKASSYTSSSTWSNLAKGSVILMVGFMGASIVRGRFIKPPTALVKNPQTAGIEKPFTQAMKDRIQQKFSQMTSKQALISGTAAGATGLGLMVGMEYLLDAQFLTHLYDADLPIWLQEILFLTKIAPSELLSLMHVKLICNYQLRLKQITYYNEFEGNEELSDAQKYNLMLFKDQIENEILPELNALNTKDVKDSDPRFMADGLRPNTDDEFKTYRKNLEVQSLGESKKWEGFDFSCGQVTIEGAIYNADRILEEIKIRTKTQD